MTRVGQLVLLLSAVVVALGGSASAALLDFEGFAVGDLVSGIGVFSDLYLTSGSNPIYVTGYVPGPPLSGSRTINPEPYSLPLRADFLISGVDAVSVDMGDYDIDEDPLYLQAYNSSNVLLDEDTYLLPWWVDGGATMNVASGPGDIAYVVFGSGGVYPGSVYTDNFAYNARPSGAVPELPPVCLAALGLLPLGLLKLRRRK